MTNPRDDLMAPDFYAISESELCEYCGADARRWAEAFCQIKARQGWSAEDIDAGLMICWFASAIETASVLRLAASRPAAQVADREAVAWPESPIAIAQRGFEKWRAKEHNKKWFRKIDGTPIPNDVVVCIAQEFADTACPVMPVRQETPDTSAAVLQEALLDATASLVAAASAYRKYASRHKHVGRAVADPFFCTRVHDFEKAAERAQAAIRQLPTPERSEK